MMRRSCRDFVFLEYRALHVQPVTWECVRIRRARCGGAEKGGYRELQNILKSQNQIQNHELKA